MAEISSWSTSRSNSFVSGNRQAAILSPSTGIVDTHELMLTLQGDLENSGGAVAVESPVKGGAITDGGFTQTLADAIHVVAVPGLGQDRLDQIGTAEQIAES